jgi:hypothetical protein
MAWTLALLAVPLLYVLTLPIVTKVGFESANRVRGGILMPRWLEIYQAPMAPLCTSDAFIKAYSDYAKWLIRTLDI